MLPARMKVADLARNGYSMNRRERLTAMLRRECVDRPAANYQTMVDLAEIA